MIAQAAAAGLDTFVTGEGPHHTFFDAEELKLNVFYAGHYATETVVSRRWPSTSTPGSTFLGRFWTTRPVCECTPRAGGARGLAARRHAAQDLRVRRHAGALQGVEARYRRRGVAHDLRAARVRRGGHCVGAAHA